MVTINLVNNFPIPLYSASLMLSLFEMVKKKSAMEYVDCGIKCSDRNQLSFLISPFCICLPSPVPIMFYPFTIFFSQVFDAYFSVWFLIFFYNFAFFLSIACSNGLVRKWLAIRNRYWLLRCVESCWKTAGMLPYDQQHPPEQPQQPQVVVVHQPQSTARCASGGLPQNVHEWSTSLFGCFQDCSNCKLYNS